MPLIPTSGAPQWPGHATTKTPPSATGGNGASLFSGYSGLVNNVHYLGTLSAEKSVPTPVADGWRENDLRKQPLASEQKIAKALYEAVRDVNIELGKSPARVDLFARYEKNQHSLSIPLHEIFAGRTHQNAASVRQALPELQAFLDHYKLVNSKGEPLADIFAKAIEAISPTEEFWNWLGKQNSPDISAPARA